MGSARTPLDAAWPDLPLAAWAPTCDTLHLWLQIVGKLRCAQCPWTNHAWHVALSLTARGLGTGPMPHGARSFEVDFDFVAHRLLVRASDGRSAGFALEPQSVAGFYRRLMDLLAALELPVAIHRYPNELPDAIRFDRDHVHGAYDPEYANRFWRVLLQAARVMAVFRAGFIGKCSPVHFFWGSADLAVSRFSGREAPRHPGGIPHLPDWITREAYSHEVSSCGFWPGGGAVPDAAFYAYAYPMPPGYAEARVQPAQAYFQHELGEFVLPYAAVQASADPDALLLAFFRSTYDAAADLAAWDRARLECALPPVMP